MNSANQWQLLFLVWHVLELKVAYSLSRVLASRLFLFSYWSSEHSTVLFLKVHSQIIVIVYLIDAKIINKYNNLSMPNLECKKCVCKSIDKVVMFTFTFVTPEVNLVWSSKQNFHCISTNLTSRIFRNQPFIL